LTMNKNLKDIAHDDDIEFMRWLVNKQAEDEGLWFKAKTAPEAYLQQELRKLHHAIEGLVGKQ